MKPESQLSKSLSGAQPDEILQWDPYVVAMINDCHDAAGPKISENISIVVDELDSTAVRRRTSLLRSDRS